MDIFLKYVEESKTEYLPYSIPFDNLIKYYLTKNLNVSLGLTNGSLITIKQVNLTRNGIIHSVIFKLEDQHRSFKLTNMNENEFMLFRNQIYFKIKKGSQEHSVKRLQFPITPTFVSTCHKAQGKTYESMIVDLNVSNSRFSVWCYLYVALS
ncbi:unnamed protein product, partial [Brachionus calyciflorus]